MNTVRKIIGIACFMGALLSHAEIKESINTVGFVEHQVNQETMMDNVGFCFRPVEGETFHVSDSIFGKKFVKYDEVYIFNANYWDFDIYTYYGGERGWRYQGADGTKKFILDFEILPGVNAFYCGANESITIAGQVESDETIQLEFDPNEDWMFFFVNPYPQVTTLGDLETFAVKYDEFYKFNSLYYDFDIYTYYGGEKGWRVLWANGDKSNITDPDTIFLEAGEGAEFVPADSEKRVWEVSLKK